MDHKKRIQGVVTSNKTDKTITVMTVPYKKHPLYQKRVETRHKYYAHDEANVANIGDVVTIEECRPISATKRFKLISVDKKAFTKIDVKEEEVVTEALHEEAPVAENTETKEAK
jgi:small subunit ribosomal protein S17